VGCVRFNPLSHRARASYAIIIFLSLPNRPFVFHAAFTENLVVIIDIRGVSKKKTSVRLGWTALNIFDAAFVANRACQLPLYEGAPTVDALRRVQREAHEGVRERVCAVKW